ncbi:uncharacterized protein LOC119332227 [Triticum dicoccoides]|uniref:uncharacterized protein LOC119332227 n=1 Tax=Triticum dicoccoides TaxID=85692 RepID=UPI001891AB17|nr:uncharacterized protein LOC119332227 [Triticum dicoccoides]
MFRLSVLLPAIAAWGAASPSIRSVSPFRLLDLLLCPDLEEIDRCTHRIEPKEVCQSSNTWSRPATSDAATIVLPALSTHSILFQMECIQHTWWKRAAPRPSLLNNHAHNKDMEIFITGQQVKARNKVPKDLIRRR